MPGGMLRFPRGTAPRREPCAGRQFENATGDSELTMRLLVLSRDAEAYRQLLSGVGDLSAEYCSAPAAVSGEADILLAEPDYAAAYVAAGHKVSWIQSTWAGVRPIVEALTAARASPVVTGVKGIFGLQIAEYVLAFLLRDVRRSALFERQQTEGVWDEVWPETLKGRTAVIFGTGSIGSELAGILKVFGVRCTGVSRSGAAVAQFAQTLSFSGCRQAVAEADIVVSTLPDTLETEGLIDRTMLESMSAGSILVNVGRGSTVDEAALADVLAATPSRKALLDVFAVEPLPANSALWRLPNVTITPHIAAVSRPGEIAEIFQTNCMRFLAGKPLEFVVDLGRGY